MIPGGSIRLRAIELDDLPRYVTWLNDPEVIRTLSLFHPFSLEDEKAWFEAIQQQEPTSRPMAIDASLDGDWVHIGSCGLININARVGHAELGIAIGDKKFWDQGLGTDAIQTLLRHSFETLNLRKIYLRVFEYNDRGKHLYTKLGFVEEGRLRDDEYRDGRYWDTFLMGIMKSEWEDRQPKSGKEA